MALHPPEAYVNIKAFYCGVHSSLERAAEVQKRASEENQPLDVVYYDEQFKCWRNFDWCSPITQESIQLWKSCMGLPSVP